MSLFTPNNLPTAEEIRELINGLDAIRALNAIDQVLQARGTFISKNEIMALGLRVKIQFGKLNKVVPDLKSVEHQHTDPIARLTDDALRARTLELSRKLGIIGPIDGDGTTH